MYIDAFEKKRCFNSKKMRLLKTNYITRMTNSISFSKRCSITVSGFSVNDPYLIYKKVATHIKHFG